MALHTNLNIFRASGYASVSIESALIRAEYAKESEQTMTLVASPHGSNIWLGMTTAKFVYIESDAAISVVLNNSIERLSIDRLFFLIGTTVTALSVIAPTGANLKIYLAGD